MNPDDPKFTAYALDELDPAGRAEVEQFLRENPDALAEVEETERLAARLRNELHSEPAAPLTEEQRDQVFAVAATPAVNGSAIEPAASVEAASPKAGMVVRWNWRGGLAMAASLAVFGGIAFLAWQSPKRDAGIVAAAKIEAPHQPRSFSAKPNPAPALPEPLRDKDSSLLAMQLPSQESQVALAAAGDQKRLESKPAEQEQPAIQSRFGFALAPADGAESNRPAGKMLNEQIGQKKDPAMAGSGALTPSGRGNAMADSGGAGGAIVAGVPTERGVALKADAASLTSRLEYSDQIVPGQPAVDALAGSAGAEALNRQVASWIAGGEKLATATANTPMSVAIAPVATTPIPSIVTDRVLDRAKASADSQLARLAEPGDWAATRPLKPSAAAPSPPVSATLRSFSDSSIVNSEKAQREAQIAAIGRELRDLQSGPATGSGELAAAPASEELRRKAEKLSQLQQEVRELEVEAVRRQVEPSNTESYDAIKDNAFLGASENPLSTFSIDVDTASYSNVRRFLNEQRLPPKGAVRIEELLNYFDYDYPQPAGEAPFSASMEVATCPWNAENRLVRIGLKGRDIHPDKRPASNLVFLVDVSGSMQPDNKLPLVKKSLRQLVDRLGGEDTVAIAVYAGASGCVLEPTNKKSEMRTAIDRLESGGSTNGAAGIQLAYQLAERSFIKGGVNRVILATDGDFNVGVTNQSELIELIEKKAKSGVFLTVLGFGMGNLKDSTLEKLADTGNGNYAYIDTLLEARKVLVEQMSGTLVTIAKDVKIQVEFNPARVSAYRLIGYENRMLKKEDFNDDTKDAGEIGAGHTVTALYEIVPAGKRAPGAPAVDPLKYQAGPRGSSEGEVRTTGTPASSHETLTLKLRYKAPDGDTSKLLEFPLVDDGRSYERSSKDFRFAAAVASFGMLLRDSPHKGTANWNSTLELAMEGKGDDRSGYRGEFVSLVERAKAASR